MTNFEIYVFILCFIVFSLLTAMFTYLLASMVKMEIELINFGHRDKEIEKQLNKKKKENRVLLLFNKLISLLFCLIFIVTFCFAAYIHVIEEDLTNKIQFIKVVKSESMAEKNPENTYLIDNNLNNQIQMFDIIVCKEIPKENELKLYDIVVYEYNDMSVIHRIVDIEEPNDKHPDEKHFILQGDAINRPDQVPVRYGQMQGIYEGIRMPFVGSFILFLQSPAGWLCFLLVVFSMITTPIVEKKIKKSTDNRIAEFSKETCKESEEGDGNE